MADVIYKKGQSSNLDNVQIKEGQILVTEDTGEMYIDVTDNDRKKINETIINQIYDKNSQNAQSGKAVAEAINNKAPKVAEGWAVYPKALAVKSMPELENIDGIFYPKNSDYKHLNIDDGYSKDPAIPDISLAKGFIATRDKTTGNLWTGTPIDDEDCANKKYVDEAVASSGGGGGSITVDQTYNAESENAQSGKAVAEAINEIDDKKVNKILRSDVTDILEYDNTPDRVPYMYGVYGNEDYEEQQGLIKSSMGKLCKEMAAQIEKDDKKGANSILSGVIPSKYRGMLDPYTVAIRDGNCSIPVGYHAYDEDKNGNIINSKLYYGAAVPYSYVDKKAVTSISVVENQTYEFDWNAMYFMKSNTNNKDIEILDGNGNRVTDYKYSYCLLILPKESFERTEWTVSKGEDRKKDTIHGLVAGMSDKYALVDTAKIEMLQFDVDPTKKLKIKPQNAQIYKIAF